MRRFNAADISFIEIGSEQNSLSASARREGKETYGGRFTAYSAELILCRHKKERKEVTKLPIRV